MNKRNGLYATSVTTLFLLLGLSAVVAPVAVRAQASATPRRAFDPVRADGPLDAKTPATMAELGIQSHGARMNGFIYVASGSGPHGIVIMLHGFPGNERNLDIAQAARRAGYDVLYFDYRGSWGSGGTFSFSNARDDVASVIEWVRSPENIRTYHIDPRHIALVGHSMGGWLAFEAAARDNNVACVAGLAAWNIGNGAKIVRTDAGSRKSTIDYFTNVTDPAAGPLRGNGNDLFKEITSNEKAYDYLNIAPALASRSIFLAAATNDSPDEGPAMHRAMEAALQKAGGKHIQNVTFDDDHPFSNHRVELTDLIVKWLNGDCTREWKARR